MAVTVVGFLRDLPPCKQHAMCLMAVATELQLAAVAYIGLKLFVLCFIKPTPIPMVAFMLVLAGGVLQVGGWQLLGSVGCWRSAAGGRLAAVGQCGMLEECCRWGAGSGRAVWDIGGVLQVGGWQLLGSVGCMC